MKKNITITLLLNVLVFSNIIANNFLFNNEPRVSSSAVKKQSVSVTQYKVWVKPNILATTSLSVVAVDVASLTCNNSTNGSATVTVSGGLAPYTYLWSNGATTYSVSNLMEGVYTCTITDAASSFTTAEANILAPSALSTTVNTTNLACSNSTNGSATLTVNGGTAPYSYLWSNGAITSSLSSLMAGVYTGTVTDANGCTINETASITAPSALSSTLNIANLACNTSTAGSATITINGGTVPYVYLWNSIPTQTTSTASNLAVGNYTCVVQDANNCAITRTLSITRPTALQATATGTAPVCNGLTNGSARVIVSGGTTPYSYSWNTSPVQTIQTATALASGFYTCTVTDNNGCTLTRTVSAYIAPQNIAISANPSSTVCVGTNVTLTASGTRTYTWSNGTTGNSTIVTPTTTSTYTMEGTSLSNCNLVGSITISTKTLGCVVGVNELDNNTIISVYPNPNNGVLTVKFDENYTGSSIEILDSYGKIVIEKPLLVGETTINISHLADGVYFYVVKTENEILQRSKLVKQ